LISIPIADGTMKLALSNNRVHLATSKFHLEWTLCPSSPSNYSNNNKTMVAEASVETAVAILLDEDVAGVVLTPTGILTCRVNRRDSLSH
jgi:hypothetical protein